MWEPLLAHTMTRVVLALVVLASCRYGFDAVAGDGGGLDDGQESSDTRDGSLDPGLPPLISIGFDEPAGAGTVAIGGTLGATASATFAQQGVPGRIGLALELGGAMHGLEIADRPELDGLSALTIELWVNYNQFSPANYSTFIKHDTAYLFRTCDVFSCGGPPVLALVVWDSNGVNRGAGAGVTVALTTGVWYHVAAVYDGTSTPYTTRVYLDGSLVRANTFTEGTGVLPDSTLPLTIGRNEPMAENFVGRLDELKFYDYARTPEQICASAAQTNCQ